MYNITKEEQDFAKLVQKEKEMFEQDFASILVKGETILNLFAEPNTLAQNFNLEKNKTFWNTARYISIISMDLKILAKHQALSTNEWEKRFFSRQVSLLIYESMDDLLFLLGKQFKKIAEDFNEDELFKTDLNQLRGILNDFKDKNFTRLQILRNTSIAHRDKDTAQQLKTIYSISWLESVNICSEFDRIINRIGGFLETLMRKGISDGVVRFNAY